MASPPSVQSMSGVEWLQWEGVLRVRAELRRRSSSNVTTTATSNVRSELPPANAGSSSDTDELRKPADGPFPMDIDDRR
eukprot:CAMPEP_0205908930 /NCGR_PEP_ID=MMETSP1325-20131115/3538_1 /ASSEMBLY_ACC=CAM_ASM_000708 /TAXON_ID=236786 /ORGANISM="Florenciella sp., Strain RCC1007" /LENGTH=78 /DNA_ID=CAMNT_0053275181 /DNA_START=107 /DNA_END=346 /DNA_ORIENTATION=+